MTIYVADPAEYHRHLLAEYGAGRVLLRANREPIGGIRVETCSREERDEERERITTAGRKERT